MFARWGLKGDSQHIEPPIPVTRKTSQRAEAGSFGTRAGTGMDPLIVGLWARRKELLNGFKWPECLGAQEGHKTVATFQLSWMHSRTSLLDTGCDWFHSK